MVKLPQAREFAQLLPYFAMKHPLEISIVDVMNMQYYMDKLKKVLISNINKHHWKTIDSYFLSVSYGVDIIMGLYIYKLHIV